MDSSNQHASRVSYPDTAQVAADFDRIASLPTGLGLDHNELYHPLLLDAVPQGCGEALDVGCGAGAFAMALAGRARRVTAVDVSPVMLARARAAAAGIDHIAFELTDVMTMELGTSRFDYIASIAALHHLPADALLARLAAALRQGGVLAIVDLRRVEGPIQWASGALALAASTAMQIARTGRPLSSAAARAAWRDHGGRDHYLSMREAKGLAARCLPGAQVRQHFFFRYSLIWKKP